MQTPDPAADLIRQGQDALAHGRYQESVKDFDKALKVRHDDCGNCHVGLAIALRGLGDLNGALAECDKALTSTDPETLLSAHMLKGKFLTSGPADAKTLKAAESEYRAALAGGTRFPQLHFELGVVLLKESQREDGSRELNTYLQLAPTGEQVDHAKALLAHPDRVQYNFAPNLDVQTLQGERVSLAQLRGKIVVLDFWATWCPPCVESVPELKRLTQKYPSDKLALISISADTDGKQWKEFIGKKKMDWSQYWDHDGQVRKSFGIDAFPTYLVIDQEGFIEQRLVGLNPQQSVVSRLKSALEEMLD